jgi:hypothetical protein
MDNEPHQPPRERAPLLRVFSDTLAGRVAGLIRQRPLLISRLITAPPEAIHSVGAYLHLSPDAMKPDATVADTITNAHPRDLLAAALPDCSPKLYRALGRAGDRVRSREFYERLGSVARSGIGDGLLDSGDLDECRLSFYETLLRMDPLIASLRGALGETAYHAEGIDSLVTFLRAHNALHEDDFRLPARAGMPALARRLQRALGRIPAPNPGFAPPAGYRLVTTTDELQAVGRLFRNCVAMPNYNAPDFHFRLLRGAAVFLVSDDPPVLVALRQVGGGLWVVEQMAGPKNAAPPVGTEAALHRNLAAAGVRIVSTDPQAAYSRLDSQSRQRRRVVNDDEGDLDEALDDDDGVEEAAA